MGNQFPGVSYVGVHKRKRKPKESCSAQATAAAKVHWNPQTPENHLDNQYSDDNNSSTSSSDKENNSLHLLEAEKKKTNMYQLCLYSSSKKAKNWHKKYDKTVEEKQLKEKEIQNLEEKVEKLEGATNQLAQDKHLDTAVKRVGRMFRLKEGKEKTVQLKEKGVIPDSISSMICDLVSLDNIPAKHCVNAFMPKVQKNPLK
ncbi:hypothetical protein BT96DRAFT_936448 [Gymnopus androsaceus JB14]|uniref:Uncharacterized protein n=1 Tax=Gymnopus androsaceus JB14 TaxID=1447944 RepID=A0A6A4HZG5_9AGAR|nr:hypothetical protein BT96DRAFT_936448 [Gymnopus androsaceus JB14]